MFNSHNNRDPASVYKTFLLEAHIPGGPEIERIETSPRSAAILWL